MMTSLNSLFSVPFSLFQRKNHNQKDFQERPKLEEFISTGSFPESKSYSGFVTSLNHGEGVINNQIYFNSEKYKNFHFKVGDHVQGEATQQNEGSAWRAVTMYPAWEEDWEEDQATHNEVAIDSFISHSLQELPSTVTGKVSSIYRKNMIELNIGITFYTNEDNCSFELLVGDWVYLVKDESVNSTPGSFPTSKVEPLRHKTIHGSISHIKSTFFVVNGEVFCQKSALPKLARLRDRVVVDVIESDQAPNYTWRAIDVRLDEAANIPSTWASVDLSSIMVTKSRPVATSPVFEDVLDSNYDVFLEVDFAGEIILESLGSSKYVAIAVANKSEHQVRIIENIYIHTKTEPQLQPDSSAVFPLVLPPGKKLPLVLNCRGKTLGASQETVVFECRTEDNVAFKVGRQIKVVVMDTKSSRAAKSGVMAAEKSQWKNRHGGRIIQGEKPFHASPFLPVKLPHVEVPSSVWEAVLGEKRVLDVAPSLAEPLSINNYVEKFSFLLFFEEVAMDLEMRKFDIPCTAFQQHGEFLSLTVEGLSENRPSLIVGDTVIASPPYVTDDFEGVQYEGIIHEIQRSKVLLKFHANFHAEYGGEDYAVQLRLNRTPAKRCHLAISQVVSQLGAAVLFPSKLRFQLPQIPFLDSDFKTSFPSHENLSTLSNLDTPSLRNLPTNTPSSKSLPTNTPSPKNLSTNTPIPKNSSINIAAVPLKDAFECGLNKKEKKRTIMKSTSVLETSSLKMGAEGYCLPVLGKSRRKQPRAAKLVWFNEDLNLEQRTAVKRILEGSTRPLPYVIFGPPGTGKTVTVVEALLQVYKMVPHSRILVVCPSNSASDLVTERAVTSGRLKTGEIVRINAFNRRLDTVPENISQYCVTVADIQSVAWHRILVTTATTAGVLTTVRVRNGHFTHVFVDEAGQLTEPETGISLGLVNSSSGQIVLAGDPKQLGPVVMSSIARKYGLNQSLLHRLCASVLYQPHSPLLKTMYSDSDTDSPGSTKPTDDARRDISAEGRLQFEPRLVTLLVKSYRSHPDLLRLPSCLFYRSCLLPSATNQMMNRLLGWEELPNPECPLIFQPVMGENMQEGDSPSWFNPAEAFQVSRYVMSLLKYGLQPSELGIITPYRKQVEKIRQLLNVFGVEDGIKVGSVEEFQGQERLAVIVSTVRSSEDFVETDVTHNLGFIRSAQRFNVAITRAVALLVVIGNPTLLSADSNWGAFLGYCVSKGAVKKN